MVFLVIYLLLCGVEVARTTDLQSKNQIKIYDLFRDGVSYYYYILYYTMLLLLTSIKVKYYFDIKSRSLKISQDDNI